MKKGKNYKILKQKRGSFNLFLFHHGMKWKQLVYVSLEHDTYFMSVITPCSSPFYNYNFFLKITPSRGYSSRHYGFLVNAPNVHGFHEVWLLDSFASKCHSTSSYVFKGSQKNVNYSSKCF